jgi:predicted phage tail protein
MKRKVYLDGELGELYGRELTMDVSSFGEVFRCLEANFPGVKQYLIDCHEKDIGFICKVAEEPLNSDEEVALRYPEGDMYISPQPAGSKSAAAKIIAAIIIVAVVYFTGGFGATGYLATGAGSFAQIAGLAALSIAINLALAGIQQLMAPDPSTESGEQDEAYLFQGSGQTILEGDPVPILYGKLRVPGRPISFRVQNENQRFYNRGDAESDLGINSTPVQNPNQDLPVQGGGGSPVEEGRGEASK